MIDLHCHSDVSDGALTPTALMRRAAERGVRALSLTDHDTVAGLDEAHAAARQHGLDLVPGVEVSVTWNGRTLHVVGLEIDPAAVALERGLSAVRSGRVGRGQAIGARLEQLGFRGAYAAALDLASNPDMVSRTHFARYLVGCGAVKDMGGAFRRYLGEGKPAYVRHTWARLDDAIAWIVSAGGIAVLAHPARYAFKSARLRALLAEFRAAGGAAVEVVCASHGPEQVALIGRLAAGCGLLASAGSDFHDPETSWLDVGQLASLPGGCEPVWRHPRLWRLAAVH